MAQRGGINTGRISASAAIDQHIGRQARQQNRAGQLRGVQAGQAIAIAAEGAGQYQPAAPVGHHAGRQLRRSQQTAQLRGRQAAGQVARRVGKHRIRRRRKRLTRRQGSKHASAIGPHPEFNPGRAAIRDPVKIQRRSEQAAADRDSGVGDRPIGTAARDGWIHGKGQVVDAVGRIPAVVQTALIGEGRALGVELEDAGHNGKQREEGFAVLGFHGFVWSVHFLTSESWRVSNCSSFSNRCFNSAFSVSIF